MTPDRIRQCLEHGLPIYWANDGYTCSVDGDKLLVTWQKGQQGENTTGLEGNHDPERFYPDPSYLTRVVDTTDYAYPEIALTPALLSRPSRFVKFQEGSEIAWVQVIDHTMSALPEVDEATELAIDILVRTGPGGWKGFGAEHVQVVI